jgi:pilus assembly protein Flp/PilA
LLGSDCIFILLEESGELFFRRILPRQFWVDKETTKVKIIKHFVQDESGATAIEYGLIASLIAVAIIAGATTLGTSLNSTFNAVAGKVTGPSA